MPVGPVITFDTTGWDKKDARIKAAIRVAAEKACMTGAQEIYDRTAEKLAGPHYGYKTGPRGGYVPDYPEGGGAKGQIPIPRLSGNLARSLKMTPLSILAWAIWSDERIAKYAKYVHDGLKNRPPRRYLKDTFDEREAYIRKMMKDMVNAGIRDAQ